MKKDLISKLKDKGWSEEEIERATRTMLNTKKTPFIAALDRIAYWVALFILIFGNFLISVLLIPFLLVTDGLFLYLFIFILAFIFGLIYNVLIEDIDKLETNHKILAGVFIPALAIINIYIIVGVTNHMITIFNLDKNNNPFLISAVYIVSFIAPYVITSVRNGFHDK